MPLRPVLTQLVAAFAVAGTLLLGGCGGVEGIELNGKLFDMLGISEASQQKSEPKMADRAPLVLPPNVSRLPDPGSGKGTTADVASLNDPDLRKAAAAKERQRLHEAYCRGEIQWQERVNKPQDVGAHKSPYGPCGVLGNATTNLTK